MRFDVYFSPVELPPGALSGAVVAVIDVLRASTTIAVALANDAKAVIPFDEADEAVDHAKQFQRGEVLLAGERKMLPISGFDLGNSPQTFTKDIVGGKPVLLTTTNGTHALLAVQSARETVVASYVNCSAVSALLRSAARSDNNLAIICAGRERHFSLEDAACAGRYVNSVTKNIPDIVLNDAARACARLDHDYGENLQTLFLDSSHGQALSDAGFGDDLAVCAHVDAYPVVPVYADRQITRLGNDRGR
jgi:2-phosphosulfolactate phosphatase